MPSYTAGEIALYCLCNITFEESWQAAVKFFYTHEMSRRLRVKRRIHWLTGQKLAFKSHLSYFVSGSSSCSASNLL